MAKEGLLYIIPAIVIMICSFLFSPIMGIPLLAATLFILYFFRDPEREITRNENELLSPADGVIREIITVHESEHLNTQVSRIIIFLSLFNVHVNRSPISGKVSKSVYHKGFFHPAFTEAASKENERNTLLLVSKKCQIIVRQIAGLLTRRIVTKIKPGDFTNQGDRFGIILFGSCVEIDFPHNSKIIAKKGDKVRAGQTVLAVLQ